MIYTFDRVEYIVEKGENAGYQHFLLFFPHTVFKSCPCKGLNPFPNDKFRLIKLSEFPGNSFEFDENGRKFSKKVENTVGKGEIAS